MNGAAFFPNALLCQGVDIGRLHKTLHYIHDTDNNFTPKATFIYSCVLEYVHMATIAWLKL